MKVLGVLVALCASVALFVGAVEEGKTDPRENLETAIPEAIRLLEAKEYVTFLTNFVNPDDFKRFTEGTTVDAFAKHFAGGNAEFLLKALQSIKEAKPTMENDGKRAVYEIKEKINGRDKLVFVKVEKFWYIEN
ncbi:MAG: hypothetical protein A2Z34_06395 [Planctomycetes bacterium RBG_16_59_8]|nr:MAG: hypothetical protein A2Z34_06395 [Planctomycetes bacterium RBG_16_59_8]